MANTVKNPKRETIEVAAIIPARAGQQSISYKNLQKLGGKTLVQWAIEVALEATTVDVVIVSTEDEKIAEEAKKFGALVAPRPEQYSQPTSGDGGFYHHAVTWMEEEFGWTPELLINLRPTSPLRFASDIDAMVAHMKKTEADGLKSVIPAPLHPYKMWHLEGKPEVGASGKLTPLADFQTDFRKQYGPDQPRQKVQKLFPIFFQDGQVDITRRKFVLRPECLENENVWGENLHGYVLDPRTSTDLDEPADFIRAEKIYEELRGERGENSAN
ncbi:MAG: acylneuraminate cytidylyltransferase family protein [Candidatus Andersenbacteria bacterium]|nr:acylneuraminate cytidylyltransferase family protein [Candidatus Andersenbacteria bacterium]MBI3251148.1 acylneuraminate cytidylyltransferase family protein [Candidatus Andersenbacteria bacterium]